MILAGHPLQAALGREAFHFVTFLVTPLPLCRMSVVRLVVGDVAGR